MGLGQSEPFYPTNKTQPDGSQAKQIDKLAAHLLTKIPPHLNHFLNLTKLALAVLKPRFQKQRIKIHA